MEKTGFRMLNLYSPIWS